MINQGPREKHWLEPVLSRELAAVEAPASLRQAVTKVTARRAFVNRKFAWAGGALAACAMGVMMHSFAGQTLVVERGAAASALNPPRTGVKAAQFSGACHLCHSDL